MIDMRLAACSRPQDSQAAMIKKITMHAAMMAMTDLNSAEMVKRFNMKNSPGISIGAEW